MTRQKLYSLVLVLSIAGYLWLIVNLFPDWLFLHESPEVCLIKIVTGFPCSSCGTTRAVLFFSQGEWMTSFLMNPFGMLIVFSLVVFPVWILIDLIRGTSGFLIFYNKTEIFFRQKLVAILAICLVLLNWIWNFTKGF